MKNTLKNKAKFVSLYFGQEVRIWKELPDNKCNVGYASLSPDALMDAHLELRKIESITDEEVKEAFNMGTDAVGDMRVIKFEPMEGFRDCIMDDWKDFTPCTDYLRSIGVARPWMGLSVEKQVEYGWVKLID